MTYATVLPPEPRAFDRGRAPKGATPQTLVAALALAFSASVGIWILGGQPATLFAPGRVSAPATVLAPAALAPAALAPAALAPAAAPAFAASQRPAPVPRIHLAATVRNPLFDPAPLGIAPQSLQASLPLAANFQWLPSAPAVNVASAAPPPSPADAVAVADARDAVAQDTVVQDAVVQDTVVQDTVAQSEPVSSSDSAKPEAPALAVADAGPAAAPPIPMPPPAPQFAAEVPLPMPRPPELRAVPAQPSAIATQAVQRPVPRVPRGRRAVAPVQAADNRSFFEKVFGLGQPSAGPALAYASPEDGQFDNARRLTSGPPFTDSRHTAVYDIAAHTVYMPDGSRLEAHSGLGNLLDDPRSVTERNRGATPPHVYDLTLRESLFHGVQAIRLNPVGGGGVFGRVGLLAHTYMLGPNGDSNGCVSFRDYATFLQAFRNGQINRLAVVART